ncbi:retinitis pigmentosa 1-like 1 protein [Lampris incognitus]|uniref:retinitis pigmentosa 1-like 1 protein n=1 Tax=Lampris incognitus TaxID=2546036 RepID=UPI0024B53A0C|nr:retinitis pigmentosa 1-like 1 protein [Lampris incognitus]
MYSAPAGVWDPHPPSKHGSISPLRPPSTSRLTHVTSAAPAKRITFYKSGDSQFGGVKMAIHKRSFKCFDALLDDLSQKVPLPFGVRTLTTPRGIHSIKQLEQLQDGGCYLCSDRRQAKPINMELAGKRPAIWHHHSKRPHRLEAPPSALPGHMPYRQRRILLVKNSEPGFRRSVVLNRWSTRSLRAFLEEVSEAMQFHVRRLYTAEGRKIDSVQSLITCPSVLVCVGREPFSPLLVDFIRKSSDEKLPGLGPRTPGNGARSPATQGIRSPPHGARSRASEYSEGYESKKNVNFGLETKKSIIHPRSDSSNRSTRYSLSSEKSYTNGLSTCSHSQGQQAIMNDDIEKRVLVNKDGSLSVEMRVRFRLQNDETLRWSTQIKKSPSGSLTNDSLTLREAQGCYLQQGQSESCSDPDSASCDPEGTDYTSQPQQHALVENHCPCCYQRQEQNYDLWENPAHSHKQPAPPPPHGCRHTHTMVRHTHSSSSSSSCHSRRVVRRRARLSDCGGGSGSEQGQMVQEEMCVTEEVQQRVEVEQDGDTQVKVCRISRCCSRSEVTATDSNLRPRSRRSIEDDRIEEGADRHKRLHDDLMMSEGEERPLSTVSNSSHVLQTLQEDQDYEEDDLPPSASQCCHSAEQTPSPPSKPQSYVSVNSCHWRDEKATGEASEDFSCHCRSANHSSVTAADEVDRATSSRSKTSHASHRSSKTRTPNPEEEGAADDEDEDEEAAQKRVLSGLSNHTGHSLGSGQLGSSSVCLHCGGCKRGTTPGSFASATSNHGAEEPCSRASHRSHHSHVATPKPDTPLSNQDDADDGSDGERVASGMSDGSDISAVSTRSNKSNLTHHGRASVTSNGRVVSAMSRASNQSKYFCSPTPPEETLTELAEEEKERALSTISDTSHRSKSSHRSTCNGGMGATVPVKEERSLSAMSAKSNHSARSDKSHKSSQASERAVSSKSETAEDTRADEKPEDRAASALSVKSARSNISAKSNRSHTSNHSGTENLPDIKSTEGEEGEEGGEEVETVGERPASIMSAKSVTSVKTCKSAKSHVSTVSLKSKCSGAPAKDTAEAGEEKGEEEEEEEARPESRVSANSAKSNVSEKSHITCKSDCSQCQSDVSPCPESAGATVIDTGDDEQQKENETEERSPSALSTKSDLSAKSSKALERSSSPWPEAVKDGEERPTSGMSVKSTKSNMSAKSTKSCRSHCNGSVRAASTSSKVEEEAEERGKAEGEETEERSPSVMSAKSAQSNISAKSTKSHKSSCNGSAQAMSESKSAAGEGEDGSGEDTGENTEGGHENTERSASSISRKSRRSNKSNYNGGTRASSKTEMVGEEVEENAEGDVNDERAASALSGKSAKSQISAKSHKSHCSQSSRLDSLAKDTANMEDDSMVGRAPSTMSVKSNTSAKSSKSDKSSCIGKGQSRNANEGDMPSVKEDNQNETNIAEMEPEGERTTISLLVKTEERADSVISVKSKSSVKSCKSNCRRTVKVLSPNPHTEDNVTIKTPEEVDEEEKKQAEEKAAKSHHSNCNGAADVPVIEAVDTDEVESNMSIKTASTVKAKPKVDGKAGRSKSALPGESNSGQMLSPRKSPSSRSPSPKVSSSPKAPAPHLSTPPSPPKQSSPRPGVGETRGRSALSVHSAASAKSNRSKCSCGASSALQKGKKEEEEKKKEEEKTEEVQMSEEVASERPLSILSSTSKRSRKDSEDAEQPPSHASSGSVTLGLPDDQDQESGDSDSGQSHISFHTKTSTRSHSKRTTRTETSSVTEKTKEEDTNTTLVSRPADILESETLGGDEEGEQILGSAVSALLDKSNMSVKSSRSPKPVCSHCGKAVPPKQPNKMGAKEQEVETGSVKSASTTRACKTTGSHLDTSENRTSSPLSSLSLNVRSKSRAKATTKPTDTAKTLAEESDNEENKAISRPSSQAKGQNDTTDEMVPSVSSKSVRPESAASSYSLSKPKSFKENNEEEQSNRSNSNLEVKCHEDKSEATSDNRSVQSAKTSKRGASPKESSSTCPLNNSKLAIKTENSSERALSHSMSAADLLRETIAAGCPLSRQSKGSNASEKTRSEKSERCRRNRKQEKEVAEPELTPASLPNASPNEVVSDWLLNIPTDGDMFTLGDELIEAGEEEKEVKEVEEDPGEEVAKEEENPEDEKGEEEETIEKVEIEEGEEEKEAEVEVDGAEGEDKSDAAFSDSLLRNCHTSVAVMNVLLNPSLGRCRSLPEVSAVYGRRLSTSAKGLLDCLAQLQLIEPTASPECDQHKDRSQRYNEIMAILQSLWLTEPKDMAEKAGKEACKDQVTPPRSSSGVGMSSGSGGSGKDNGNEGGIESPLKLAASIHEEVEAEEEAEGEAMKEHVETGEDVEEEEQSVPAEESVQSEHVDTPPSSPKHGDILSHLDSPKAIDSPSSLDKSSANDSSKSPSDNERETPEDFSSGTTPNILRGPLSKRPSQDPDPVWVLHLLKKLEKQFMSHYTDAMEEFKVRWELDDSAVLDTMIAELRNEVRQRIQTSIDRELRKIQSRAGRGARSPRPPHNGHLSRESTMTERRRRMLKVMKNQSVKTADSLSDGEMTGDFSDQRSEDDYCPCDACVRKKMAARPVRMHPSETTAPMMMEFDLLKILQLKSNPVPEPEVLSSASAEEKSNSTGTDEEGRNLEVEEEEEEEETKEDIEPGIVLEETIPEEDEEEEEEEEKESEKGESETAGEGTEEEISEEKEEEEEEESNKDTGTGDTEGGGETSENGQEEEEEECAAPELKAEKEEAETTEKESEEEEAAGETEGDSTAKESTSVEEQPHGDQSGSAEAEDEDDGEDDTDHGEETQKEEGSNEDTPPPQEESPTLGVTEGEEADAEDSDSDNKNPSNASGDESGQGADETAGAKESEEEIGEDIVEEVKPEEDEKEEENAGAGGQGGDENVLLHQITRTSVESQPGSMEAIDTVSTLCPASPVEVQEPASKLATTLSAGDGAAGKSRVRSKSPARIKHRKPKKSDVEL